MDGVGGEYVRHIGDSARHLLDLMSDILDAARLGNRSLPIEEAPVDLSALLRCSAEMVRPRAGKADIGIELDVEPGLRLMGDERRIRQTVVNILVNAVKFSHPGAHVRLAAYREFSGGLVVEICDSGIGIPEDEIERVTLPFAQVRHPSRPRQDGAGLGLTLAKAFMELHQGSLRIDSILDRGTTVTLRFPPERTVAAA